MKIIFITIGFLLIMAHLTKGQMTVEDKNKRRQAERMVSIRWGKFKPWWYFALFHNKYKNGKDKRIMLQLAPTLASLKLNSDETENEKDDISDVHGYQVAQQANTLAESHYWLHYKKVFERLDKAYYMLYIKCTENKVSAHDILKFEDERSMLHEYLQAVREGNIVKGESAEAMGQIKNDYKRLIAAMKVTINLYGIKRRFLEIKAD